MRPKKERWVSCKPQDRCFKPKRETTKILEGVVLSIDELEAMRLSYIDELDQEEVAKRMKIHRSTISRILFSANKKVTDALVNLKAIKIEGGCCKFIERKKK